MVLTDVWCSTGAVTPAGTLIQTGGFKDGDSITVSAVLWIEVMVCGGAPVVFKKHGIHRKPDSKSEIHQMYQSSAVVLRDARILRRSFFSETNAVNSAGPRRLRPLTVDLLFVQYIKPRRGKQTRSGSSLASDLFGSAKDAAADSSPGIFSVIFPPPMAAEINTKKNPKSAVSLSGKKGSCGESHSRSSTFEPYPEDKIKPYHYGSSIYYGAQDVYFEPESTQKHGSSSSSSTSMEMEKTWKEVPSEETGGKDLFTTREEEEEEEEEEEQRTKRSG
ncbi:hypothetical protein M569_12019 [Genlisea aurea]|uniref:Uncharacterized protein n=1 Tax=Genlisea aurea TaxID=192259 RepID=S8C7K2_9LAMI|nr:hypothetical protein M569_12019 [Genlisea aurea]